MEYRWFCLSHIDLHKWLILLTTYSIGTTVSLSPKWLNQNKKHFFLKSCKQAVTVCMRTWFKWVIIDYNRNSLVAGIFLFSFLMHCLLLSEKNMLFLDSSQQQQWKSISNSISLLIQIWLMCHNRSHWETWLCRFTFYVSLFVTLSIMLAVWICSIL